MTFVRHSGRIIKPTCDNCVFNWFLINLLWKVYVFFFLDSTVYKTSFLLCIIDLKIGKKSCCRRDNYFRWPSLVSWLRLVLVYQLSAFNRRQYSFTRLAFRSPWTRLLLNRRTCFAINFLRFPGGNFQSSHALDSSKTVFIDRIRNGVNGVGTSCTTLALSRTLRIDLHVLCTM